MESDIPHLTQNREILFDFLKNNRAGHITADEIAGALAEKGIKMGLATIYRALDYFETQNFVRKYIVENGKKCCYQFLGTNKECLEHYHMKCTKCGNIIHFECAEVAALAAHILQEHHFTVDNTRTVFYGICGTCGTAD